MQNSMVESALTYNVEDYYHVSVFSSAIRRSEWDSFESRVVTNTKLTLEALSEKLAKVTFFVPGWVAV